MNKTLIYSGKTLAILLLFLICTFDVLADSPVSLNCTGRKYSDLKMKTNAWRFKLKSVTKNGKSFDFSSGTIRVSLYANPLGLSNMESPLLKVVGIDTNQTHIQQINIYLENPQGVGGGGLLVREVK